MLATLRRLAPKLAASGLGLLLMVVVLELGLRVAGALHRPIGLDDASLRSVLADGAEHLVLCIGDSNTYGIGAGSDGDYPSQLEGILNAQRSSEQRVAVVNGGVAGANTTMMLDALPGFLESTEPDLVILLAGTTNLSNFYGYERWRDGDSAGVRLREALRSLRVVRLVALVSAELRMDRRSGARMLHGTSAAVAAYERWWSQHGDGALPEPFIEGTRLLRLGAFDEAMERFERGSASEPELSCHHWGMGMAAWGQRDREAAVAHLERAAAVDPSDPNAHAALGELLLSTDNHAAVRWVDRGIAVDPGFSGNHWVRAMSLSLPHHHDAMFESIQRCVQADPQDARCFVELGRLEQDSAVYARAMDWLESLSGRNQLAADSLAVMVLKERGPAVDPWVEHDLREMVRLCWERDIPVLIQGYAAPWDPSLTLQRTARGLNVPWVDQSASFQQLHGDDLSVVLHADGHPNDRGYRLVAENLARAIERYGLLGSAHAR